MRRQLLPAERLEPGDLLVEPDGSFVEVARRTGSPGRKSTTAAPFVRVFVIGRAGYRTLRADSPVAIQRRVTKPAGQLTPGDLIRLRDANEYRTVTRVTGSPGRRSTTAAPLLRIFLEDATGFEVVRSDARVRYRPGPMV